MLGVKVPAGSCCPAAAARSGCDGVGDIDGAGGVPRLCLVGTVRVGNALASTGLFCLTLLGPVDLWLSDGWDKGLLAAKEERQEWAIPSTGAARW